MAITFYDKEEAKEFAKRLEGMGTTSKITEKIDSRGTKIWVVKQTGKLRILGARYISDITKEDKVVLEKGASSTTRLHEIAHKELGHKGGRLTLEELVRQEIEADEYAYKKMGRNYNVNVLGGIATKLIREEELTPSYSLELIDKVLIEKGYKLTGEDKEDLLKYLMIEYKDIEFQGEYKNVNNIL